MKQATVEFSDGALLLRSSDRHYRLMPAAPDLFGAQTFAYDAIDAVAFVRGSDGKVVAMDWDGNRYGKR